MITQPKINRLNARLTDEQWERLNRKAKADNRTVTGYIIHHLNLNGLKGGRPKLNSKEGAK